MRLTRVLKEFLIAVTLCLGLGNAQAADTDRLVGHWQGHDTSKPDDARHFVLDIASVNADLSFAVQWGVDDKKINAQGKIDNNAVTINLPNGNSVSLFRASDGSLAGGSENKDGSPGTTLVFAKGEAGAVAASASLPSGGGQGCQYRPMSTGGSGATLTAKDGEEVVARLGRFRCVNGKLQRLN